MRLAGFAGPSVYHTDKILRLSQDLPVILQVVEFAERRIEQILPRLAEIVERGQITLEKVRVILYRAAKK
jgi:PII-like signaling protein